MYHFPKSAFEENVKSKKERRRERKQNRKSSARQNRDESAHNLCGTFPVLVEPKLTRHRSRRRRVSPDPVESSPSLGETDISDCDECYGISCANRENNGGRVKHSTKNTDECSRPGRRPRKKKKSGSKVEDESIPYVPVFTEKPPSRNGVSFHMDNSYRNHTSGLMSKRRSLENLLGLGKGPLRDTPPPRGFGDLPVVREMSGRMKRLKPHKLPPIDQAKRKQ